MNCANSNPGYSVFDSDGKLVYPVNTDSTTPALPTTGVPFTVEVTISDLRIRTGAGTNYQDTGKFTGKGVFTITEFKAGTGSVAGWGKLKSGAGWISLDYAKKL